MDNPFQIPQSVLDEALPYTVSFGSARPRYKTFKDALKNIRRLLKDGVVDPLLLAMGEVKVFNRGEPVTLSKDDLEYIVGSDED